MRTFSANARRPSYFDADTKLQELVEAEFDVMLRTPPGPASTRPRKKPDSDPVSANEDVEPGQKPLPDDLLLPFSPDEESFITSSIAFLRERPNADLLLEEVWSAIIGEPAEAGEAMVKADSDAGTAEKPPLAAPPESKPEGEKNV